jgi:SsrA-binding protein
MAKSKHNKNHANLSQRIVNRRAGRDYHITDNLEVGISLRGTEVKSIRNGQVSLAEGFAMIEPKTMQLFLHDVDIATYPQAGEHQHAPKRIRRLLAHKRQIEQLFGKITAKGTTLVPLAMYFKDGMIKLEIGVGVGKRHQDKRQDIKKRDADRQIQRGLTRKTIR